MRRIIHWLKSANGWQRLWLMLSALYFIYIVLINPYLVTSKSVEERFEFRWSVESEMKNPECVDYMAKPFNQLAEPPYKESGGCYHIYLQRMYGDSAKTPYTVDDVQREFWWRAWEIFYGTALAGALFASVYSAALYGMGLFVAWVVKGFRKPQS